MGRWLRFLLLFKAARPAMVRQCGWVVRESPQWRMGEVGKAYKEATVFPNALGFATDKVCENRYIAAHWARTDICPALQQFYGLAESASIDARRAVNALRG
jgi:hypothetical protein